MATQHEPTGLRQVGHGGMTKRVLVWRRGAWCSAPGAADLALDGDLFRAAGDVDARLEPELAGDEIAKPDPAGSHGPGVGKVHPAP